MRTPALPIAFSIAGTLPASHPSAVETEQSCELLQLFGTTNARFGSAPRPMRGRILARERGFARHKARDVRLRANLIVRMVLQDDHDDMVEPRRAAVGAWNAEQRAQGDARTNCRMRDSGCAEHEDLRLDV